MSRHHGNSPRAWRLILAKLHFDDHAQQIIRAEINDCPDCWRDIAEYLADEVMVDLFVNRGWDTAVRHTEGVIEGSLDAVARDRGEWAPEP